MTAVEALIIILLVLLCIGVFRFDTKKDEQKQVNDQKGGK